MRDWTPKANEADRVEMLVHVMGHYLGAVDSPEATSVMRPLSGDDQVRAQKLPLQFDALNTLLLNIVAEQVRTAGPAEWQDLPPKLQRQPSRDLERYRGSADAPRRAARGRSRGETTAIGQGPLLGPVCRWHSGGRRGGIRLGPKVGKAANQ